jgi:hypothetical protein
MLLVLRAATALRIEGMTMTMTMTTTHTPAVSRCFVLGGSWRI